MIYNPTNSARHRFEERERIRDVERAIRDLELCPRCRTTLSDLDKRLMVLDQRTFGGGLGI